MCSYFNNTNNYLPKSVVHPRRRTFRYLLWRSMLLAHRIAVQKSNKNIQMRSTITWNFFFWQILKSESRFMHSKIHYLEKEKLTYIIWEFHFFFLFERTNTTRIQTTRIGTTQIHEFALLSQTLNLFLHNRTIAENLE